jgi:hypothetical protein
LRKGVFDTLNSKKEKDFQNKLSLQLEKVLDSREESKETIGGSGSVVIPPVFLNLGGSSNYEISSSILDKYKLDKDSVFRSQEYTDLLVKVASPKIVDAWRDAYIKRHGEERIVVTVSGNCHDPDGLFIVTLNAIPRSLEAVVRIKLVNASSIGAKPVGRTVLQGGASLAPFSGLSQVYQRDGRKEVTIAYDFDGIPSKQVNLPSASDPKVAEKAREDASLSGVWYDYDHPQHLTGIIQRLNGEIVLINANNDRTFASWTRSRTLITTTGVGWIGLTAIVDKGGDDLVFSDGSRWERYTVPPASLSGVWYHQGHEDQVCLIIERSKESITVVNELHFGKAISRYDGPLRILVDENPEWKGLTGSLGDNGQRIDWSNGDHWTKKPRD